MQLAPELASQLAPELASQLAPHLGHELKLYRLSWNAVQLCQLEAQLGGVIARGALVENEVGG